MPSEDSKAALVILALTSVVEYAYPIPEEDVLFAIAFSIFLFVMNAIRFDNNRLAMEQRIPHTTLGRSKFLGTPGFTVYVGSALLSSILLPALVMVVTSWGLATEDEAATMVAHSMAPHLFVFLAQATMEQATNRPWIHDLIRIMVPIGFSVWRQWSLWTWMQTAWELQQSKKDSAAASWTTSVNLVLAVFNYVFHAYNLLVFLPMRMTTVYLDPTQCPDPNVKWVCYLFPVVRAGQSNSH